MLSERITGIMNGQLTPLPDPPTLSSAGSGWSGFLLESFIVHSSRAESGWSWHSTHVGVCTGGASTIRVTGGAGRGRFAVRPCSISIFPSGCDHTTISHAGKGVQFTVIELERSRLERLLHDDRSVIDERLVPQLYIHDPHIVALLGNMRAEVEAGCPSDPLYGESLCLALVAYLSGRYSTKTTSRDISKQKFSRAKMRTILDYINAHLARDLSMVELASIVHLSPRHFSRLFQNTLGTTAHRYVVAQRVKQAKVLLKTERLSPLEVSATLGFASQSHFSDVFRKTTGVSPRHYQRRT